MTIAAEQIVRSERLDLPLLDAALLDALIAGDLGAIASLADFQIPESFPDDDQREFLRFRRSQLATIRAAIPGRYAPSCSARSAG